jgi:hypothetical protein
MPAPVQSLAEFVGRYLGAKPKKKPRAYADYREARKKKA